MSGPLHKLGVEANVTNRANGFTVLTPSDWNDVHLTYTLTTLIGEEVFEAGKEVRKDNLMKYTEELADIIIRTTGVAEGLGIDLDAAVAAKMAENRLREYRHGGKRA